MTLGIRRLGVIGVGVALLAPVGSSAQAGGIVVSVGSGLNVPGASSRFGSTDPGYVVEGSIGISLSDSWSVGAGGEWGTFGAEVPEFSVFAPFDHAPWLEYTMLYGRLRHLLGRPDDSVSPFIEGRLGWVRELAEYSGAEIHRRGFATGASAGLGWAMTSRVSLRVTGTVVAAYLGSARLEGVGGAAPGSLASYGKLSGGFDFRIGG